MSPIFSAVVIVLEMPLVSLRIDTKSMSIISTMSSLASAGACRLLFPTMSGCYYLNIMLCLGAPILEYLVLDQA